MANINPLDIEYFESFANEIEGKFNRVKMLVSNNVASGNYHEEVLRTILRNFLTKRFSVKTGFIYKDKNEVSNQIDILIVDESSPAAYLFQEGDFAVVIPDAVVATMEVKTTLNASDWDKAVSNIASAKRLFEFPVNLTSIVFGYRGTIPTDKRLNKWFTRSQPVDILKNEKPLHPDAVLFFSDGCLLTPHNEEGNWSRGGKYYHKLFRSDEVKKESVTDTGWQISIILAMIVSACEHKDFQISRRFKNGSIADKLVQMEGSMRSHSRFKFGEGLSRLNL